MSGAAKDYKFGTKGNWRRTVHNQITDRLYCHPRDAVALYLAGAQDLDRQEFLRRGFKPDNLIAIERDASATDELRCAGTLTIRGEFQSIVGAWRSQRVSVVFGDFCCGIEPWLPDLLRSMILNPSFDGAVIVFNFLRGRDGRSNAIRSKYNEKHRGAAACLLYSDIFKDVVSSDPLFFRHPGPRPIEPKQLEAWCDACSDVKPSSQWTGTYKSQCGQHFDSCVFENHSPESLLMGGFAAREINILFEQMEQKGTLSKDANLISRAKRLHVERTKDDVRAYQDSKFNAKRSGRDTRRIAAIKAIRTMRLQAHGH
jgi:hypothetical protein